MEDAHTTMKKSFGDIMFSMGFSHGLQIGMLCETDDDFQIHAESAYNAEQSYIDETFRGTFRDYVKGYGKGIDKARKIFNMKKER